jgi:universal stress protein E
MKDLTSILVVVDPTAKAHPAIERAAWIAARTGAKIELFICEYDQYLAGERFFDSAALEKARASLVQRTLQRLRKLAQPLLDKGLAVSTDAAWDHPLHEGIVRKVTKSGPGLVVKDTHYHPLIRRSLFSNTDWNLIRECPAPLMLVKPDTRTAIETVIVAVDPVHERDKPAELDHQLINAARDLCAVVGSEMHLVHAFDPAPAYAVSADAMSFPIAEPMKELMQGLKEKHQHAMDDLLAHHPTPKSNVHLVEGDTRGVLTSMIEELRADLVVMGAVSRGALKRLLLGSTAELLLDHIPCDLLIIKKAPGA